MLSPENLELLTRFHILNETTLPDDTRVKLREEKKDPSSGEVEEAKMERVDKENVFTAQGGSRGIARATTQQVLYSRSFIVGQNADPGYGSGAPCPSNGVGESNGMDESDYHYPCNVMAVNDLSISMQGVALSEENAEFIKIKRSRGSWKNGS